MSQTIDVCVYPDGEVYFLDEVPDWLGDDCEHRKIGFCNICLSDIIPIYGEELAYCSCTKERPWKK